jgi:ethanolaminephosphotransferase
MMAKQQEMDSVVNEIYASMEREAHLQSTLLVLCGDHGMSDAGNHGGSSTGETSPALLFVSPKFQGKGAYRDSPVDAFNTMQYYRTVEQADITPTLSGLLGMPIPLNNLGVFIPELLMMWEHSMYPPPQKYFGYLTPHLRIGSHRFHILLENCKQLLKTVKATFPGYDFELGSIPSDCEPGTRSGVEGIQCAWLRILGLLESKNAVDLGPETESALLHFSRTAQNVMSSTSSNYDVTRLNLGLYIGGFAVLVTLSATYKLISRFRHAGAFLILCILGYGAMMFASSYVEEEQQFWYWIVTGWTFYLHVRSFAPVRGSSSSHPLALLIARNAGSVGLAITHRIIRRWNQTGQKFSGEPDIARGFFPSRPNLLWLLIILTYADTCRYLLVSMPASIVWCLTAVAATMAAFLFKLNFVASDSPELLSSSPLGPFGNESIPLVSQARLAFCGVALLMVLPVFIRGVPRSSGGRKGKC